MKKLSIAVPALRGANLQNYLDALARAGAEAVVSDRASDFDGCRGLLLPGGWDVDPALYGQANRGSLHIDRRLDDLQLAVLDRFVKTSRPVLGICRGEQLINVYFGGTLIQHLPTAQRHQRDEGSPFDKIHDTRTEEGSVLHRLYGADFTVNSSHHQAVDVPGDGLTITQYADDGTVEGFQHDSLPVLAVQWHPERMTGQHSRSDTVDGGRIIEYFIGNCKEYSELHL